MNLIWTTKIPRLKMLEVLTRLYKVRYFSFNIFRQWLKRTIQKLLGLIDKASIASTCKSGPGLPLDIFKVLTPICQELCIESLSKKCTHGLTQNQN